MEALAAAIESRGRAAAPTSTLFLQRICMNYAAPPQRLSLWEPLCSFSNIIISRANYYFFLSKQLFSRVDYFLVRGGAMKIKAHYICKRASMLKKRPFNLEIWRASTFCKLWITVSCLGRLCFKCAPREKVSERPAWCGCPESFFSFSARSVLQLLQTLFLEAEGWQAFIAFFATRPASQQFRRTQGFIFMSLDSSCCLRGV